MIEHGDVHGRHPVHRRGPELFDRRQALFRSEEFVRHDHRRAIDRGAQRSQHATKTMIERNADANTVLFRKLLTVTHVVRVQQNVAVRERGSLGETGRPRGVLNIDFVGG